jgi:DNA-binding IclR family transcriptional regulator
MTGAVNSFSGRQPKAVQSALRVLEQVARAGAGVTAKEVSAALDLPSATTYRLLNILVGEGYLVRLPDLTGFALGHKIGVLIDAAVAPTVPAAAREVLEELRLTVRFGVHLAYFTNTAGRLADVDTEYPPPQQAPACLRAGQAAAGGEGRPPLPVGPQRDAVGAGGPRRGRTS